MATIFVNSGAAGANNGTSWTDAYTSLASTSAAAAGDIIKVHNAHSQSGLTATINWANGTLINPVRILCVNKDAADALSTGAVVAFGTNSNIGFTGSILVHGLSIGQSAAVLRLLANAGGMQTYESCTFNPTGTTGLQFGDGVNGRWKVRLRNCTVDLSGGSADTVLLNIAGTSQSIFDWLGGTYTCRATQTSLFNFTFPLANIEGVTFSGTVTNIFIGATTNAFMCRIARSIAPTYTNVFGTTPTSNLCRVRLEGFVSGTVTAPLLPPTQVFDLEGTIATSLARYRSNGAHDGSQANAYSWEMISDADASDFIAPLISQPITRWVNAGSQVLKVYVASGVTLQDDEFWIEVLSPSEAGSATAAAVYRTTRPASLATPANLTTDSSSTWTGAGVGTKQYATVTIAPTIPGPVSVRVHLAKPSTTVYVDPVIEVAGDTAGRSRYFDGVQMFGPTGIFVIGG